MASPSPPIETTPLIQPSLNTQSATLHRSTPTPPSKPQRTVTFNPHTTVNTTGGTSSSTALRPASDPRPTSPGQHGSAGQPMLSAFNSKLRRRNSHGAPVGAPPSSPVSKIGPQRTTKNAQKLKLLPNPDPGDDGPDEESGRDVYSQFTRIKDPTARRDAARLGKADRDKLPRVTAYCTASSYRLDGLMKYLKGRGRMRGAIPKLFDECIYTPYNYRGSSKAGEDDEQAVNESPNPPKTERRYSDSAVEVDDLQQSRREDLIDLHTRGGDISLSNGEDSVPNHTPFEMHQPMEPLRDTLDFDTQVHTPEVFLFNYGTIVIWGMSLQQEKRFLKEIAKFENEKLAQDDVQTENFNFYYTREYQARIYNDFISLREKKNYMTKLAISHALAQSVKTSLFEDLVDNTIDTTKDIPEQIALTGKINLTRREINMQIGELFILRINIHLQGSVLDSPELMWAEPQLEPVYQAVRSYLEMNQRVGLLTERLNVLADLLAVLKDQLAHTHGEYLEWIDSSEDLDPIPNSLYNSEMPTNGGPHGRRLSSTANIPPSLPPTVERAYRLKCVQLKRRISDVDDCNDAYRLRKIRLNRGIMKMRLERAFLLEQLTKRMKDNVDESEGSTSPPPTWPGQARPPPRPKNAYMIFCDHARDRVRLANEGTPDFDIHKSMAQDWHDLGPEGQKPYFEIYEERKEAWEEEMGEFRRGEEELRKARYEEDVAFEMEQLERQGMGIEEEGEAGGGVEGEGEGERGDEDVEMAEGGEEGKGVGGGFTAVNRFNSS
ncbi:MAG: hypothetical protein M1812_001231 [Candelaria pacifica]|nr:MAG: hypothetical protein M1812_001231 [Candelaria pacifica]